MLLILEPTISREGEDLLLSNLSSLGVQAKLIRSAVQTTVFILSDVRSQPTHVFSRLPGVVKVVRLSPTYPLVSKDASSVVSQSDSRSAPFTLGPGPAIMAGPCSVEGLDQIIGLAQRVKRAGATMLRGGAFKPRTSPYEFPGLGLEGLRFLAQAGKETQLPVVSEIMSIDQIELALPFVDILQIGARNMYNYDLLREVGRTDKPILLKRGLSATIDEYMHAAEYILLQGNKNVILCERGIRTFEQATRNTLDLSAVPLLKSLTHLPVIVDPSHATGKRSLVRPMSRAAIACGADGLMIEVHDVPNMSISDAEQAIDPQELALIVQDVRAIKEALQASQSADTGVSKTSLVTPGRALVGTAASGES